MIPVAQQIKSQLTGASWIRKMFEEGTRLKAIYGDDKIFDFTLGNPITEPPAEFHTALRELAARPVPGMHRYMSNAGYPETRQAVAATLAGVSGQPVKADQIVMTVGAGGGLNIVLKTILDPEDEVIICAPFFVEYKFYVQNHGGRVVVVDTRDDFQLDTAAIAAAITPHTKAILINSPNNPTGVVYAPASLDRLNRIVTDAVTANNRPVYVISDEPYAKIAFDGIQVPPVFRHITNSIVVTSHSKDLALPGERIGYVAANPAIAGVNLLVEGFVFANRILGFVNAPALMQRLITGLQGLSVDVAAYQENRDLLYNNLTALGFSMVKPQGAFYLFPRSPLPDDIDFIQAALKHNILVVPGSGFGKPGYFRIAFCVEKKMIENSLPAFKALATELGL